MTTTAVSLNQRTVQNHYRLAPECGELLRSFQRYDDTRSFELGFASPGLPQFLTEFPFAVSPWPLLISAETRERFTRIVRAIPAVLHRAILRFYDRDRAGFSAHYGLPAGAYERFAAQSGEVDRLVVRWDLVLVDHQPRLIEANIGSKLGGWQIDWLWPRAAHLVRSRRECREWTVSHTHTVERFCRFLHHAIEAHVGDAASGLVLVLLSRSMMASGFPRELAAVYDRVARETSLRGRLLFETDVRSIAINPRGRVEYQGREIDGVLAGTRDRLPPELSDAHFAHQLFFPDNWVARLFADKTNFAILHAARSAGWLSDADAQLVDEYIPWSASLTDEVIAWGDDVGLAHDLARARRADLVLKQGVSWQGQDVFVGRFLSDAEWAAALARAGTNGDWLLQEYCPPDRLYAPNHDSIVTEHDAVWGIFALGDAYGGVFLRLMDAATNRGVINASRGADECVVLDV